MRTTGKSASSISTGRSTEKTQEPQSKSATWGQVISRAVLCQAIVDAINGGYLKDAEARRQARKDKLEAIAWFGTQHCREVMEIAGVDPHSFRAAVRAMLAGTPVQARFIAKNIKKQLLKGSETIQLPV